MNSPLATFPRHSQFYFDTVVFLVEKTLFKVPSRYFYENSEVFRDARLVSKGDAIAEGSLDESPIKLPLPEDATADDFATLLRIIVPLVNAPAPQDLTFTQYLSVLKLSTCWGFTDLRKLAIAEMSKRPSFASHISKIELGRKYRVRQWVFEGLKDLMVQSLPPLKDLKALGDETVIGLLYARDGASRNCVKCGNDGRPYCTKCFEGKYRDRYHSGPFRDTRKPASAPDYNSLTEKTFAAELSGLAEAY
ncbi:hypothetical protein Moror_17876 [Moniliophthora roreri MCA 2997]|uniref:BTB domain-containing protein n=1 Tax=Moniliophthora roreri (strain MCA 2997) TaxID=1381753 RepID=V2XXH0_MONRO|nr:hypothetical protein Moror_17876 [Moniliophthora roreri MCA 2997]